MPRAHGLRYTVCQMPLVGVYQQPISPRFQYCLPRVCAVGIVRHAQAQVVVAFLQRQRDVQGKRAVSAHMMPHMGAVDIHIAGIVHRAKAQQNTLPLHVRGHAERSAVPQDGVDFIPAQAAFLALIAERHHNGQRQLPAVLPALGQAAVIIVKSKLPRAVQVVESVARKVRARMLRTGDGDSCRHMLLLQGAGDAP